VQDLRRRRSAGAQRSLAPWRWALQALTSRMSPMNIKGVPVLYYENAVQFLRDVRSEVRKVTFPSRKETIASTIVVIAVVFVVSIYLGIVDVGLSVVLSGILR